MIEVKAKVRAVPRKGALHGVAKTVVKIPLRKSPQRPSFISMFPKNFPPGVTK